MRRKERQTTEQEAWDILAQAEYGMISMVDQEGEAYSVPVSYAVMDGRIVFHGAFDGKKVQAWTAHPRVCFSCVSQTKIPGPITPKEYEETMKTHGNIGPFLGSHFTTAYASAIAHGDVTELTDEQVKHDALLAICDKYTPYNRTYFEDAIQLAAKGTAVYQIAVQTITGKQNRC